MNKKLLLTIITMVLLLAGCGIVTPTNQTQQDEQSTSVTTTTNSAGSKSQGISQGAAEPVITSDEIDYNPYIKKVWIVKDGTNNDPYGYPSFCISEIENGKIAGKFSSSGPAVPSNYYYLPDHYEDLTGTIDNGTAECQFSDEKGNKGNIKLVFKANDEIESIIKYTEKSQDNKYYKDGTFQFRPYNLNNDMKEVSIIKDQSFTVDLNSWGNVRFVTGKAMGGNDKHPTDFYLTDEDENIFYDFDFGIYNIDVNAVSFQDVNKDGLKDIIIIIGESYVVPYGSGKPLGAEVFYQKTDGSFDSEGKLNKELDDSGNYKDIKTVTDYLSKKF